MRQEYHWLKIIVFVGNMAVFFSLLQYLARRSVKMAGSATALGGVNAKQGTKENSVKKVRVYN